MRVHLHLIKKGSVTHSHDLAVYVLILINVFDWHYFTQCLIFCPLMITFLVFTVFDAVSTNIDNVLLIKPSANMFDFGDFDVQYKD